MVNLGGAQVNFNINGLSKNITNLQDLITKIEKLQVSYSKERSLSKYLHDSLVKTNKLYRDVAGSASYVQGGKSLLIAKLKEEQAIWARVTAAIEANRRALDARRAAQQRAAILTPQQRINSALASGNVTNLGRNPISSRLGAVAGGASGGAAAASLAAMQSSFNPLTRLSAALSSITGSLSAKLQALGNVIGGLPGRFRAYLASLGSANQQQGAAGKSAQSLGQKYNQLIATMRKFYMNGDVWWKRFGMVAGGFWIAYRAINAIEIAISSLTRTFARGVLVMDEYRSGIAIVAGMLALLSKGQSGFGERFENFKGLMADTMQESIRLAPLFKLSIDEISEAYKELAQFGVAVTKDMTEKTLVSIAMIREIAHTVGSSSRQLRQEIQSLFNGQTRVTDQFGRFLKRIPELEKALYGIAKANTTNADKWRMVIDAMQDYRAAIYEAVNTFSGQFSVMKNNLEIISSLALSNSGIYSSWVVALHHFNKELITTGGELGPLGEKLYKNFGYLWQILARIPMFLVELARVVSDIYSYAVDILRPYKEQLILLGKMLVIGFAFSAIWSTIQLAVTLILFPFKKVFLSVLSLVTVLMIVLKYVWAVVAGFVAWAWRSGLVLAILKVIVATIGLAARAVTALLLPFAKVAVVIGTVVLGAIGFATILHGAYGLVEDIIRAFKILGSILPDIGWLITHPFEAFGEEGKKVIASMKGKLIELTTDAFGNTKKRANDFIEDLAITIDAAMSGVGGAFSKITGEGQKLLDNITGMASSGVGSLTGSVTDMVSEAYTELVTLLKAKFPSLFQQLNDTILPKDLAEQVKNLFNLAGITMPDGLTDESAAKGEKTITRWLKLIEELENELKGIGLDQYERKVLDIANKYNQIRIELAEAAKKSKEVAKIEGQILGLIAQVEGHRVNQVIVEKQLNDLAQERYEIERKLRLLRTSYDNYSIGTRGYLSEQIRLQRELIASEQASLQLKRNEPEPDTSAIQDQLNKIEEMKDKLSDLQGELSKFNRDIVASMADGVKRWMRELSDMAKHWEQFAFDIASATQSSMSDVFFDWMKGELKDAEDYWKSFGDAVYRIMADMLAKMVALNLGKALFGENFAGGSGVMSYSSGVGGGFFGALKDWGGAALSLFGMGGGTSSSGASGAAGLLDVPGMNWGGRALGGPVQARTPYIVGEKGRELFVPSMAGSIIPNSDLRGFGDGWLSSFASSPLERVLSNKDNYNNNYSQGGLSITVPVKVENGDRELAAKLNKGIEKVVLEIVRSHS